MRESNSRPLAPEARIIPLDQSPSTKKYRGDARIELATSCTQSKNHTTRPITHACLSAVIVHGSVSEWLRRQIRNLLGFARASSNLVAVDFFLHEKKKQPQAGLEPAISASGGQRLIH